MQHGVAAKAGCLVPRREVANNQFCDQTIEKRQEDLLRKGLDIRRSCQGHFTW